MPNPTRTLPLIALAVVALLSSGCGGSDQSTLAASPAQAPAVSAATKSSQAEQARQVEAEVRAAQGAKTQAGARALGVAALPPPPAPGGNKRPAAASYNGQMTQRGSVATDNVDYLVVLKFSPQGDTVSYPNSDCTGTLTLAAVHSSSSQYDEHFTSGKCRAPGIWTIRRIASDELTAVWTRVATTFSAQGDLVG